MVGKRNSSSVIRLREWREHRGDSIQTVADRAGVSRATVFRIESGRSSPTVAILEKLARALNIRVGDFFSRRAGVARRRRQRRRPSKPISQRERRPGVRGRTLPGRQREVHQGVVAVEPVQ